MGDHWPSQQSLGMFQESELLVVAESMEMGWVVGQQRV